LRAKGQRSEPSYSLIKGNKKIEKNNLNLARTN